jgi:ribulose-bisphosphate carboxylase large chain
MSSETPPRAAVADRRPLQGNHSKIIRHGGGFEWDRIGLEPYKATGGTWSGITRRELVGKRGESTRFHVRYFEIEAGGHSSLERHQHEHVVIPLRGTGEVRLGCETHSVGFGDTVYVAPGDPHQLRCPADASEPFGFLCIVNAERDAPEPLDGADACGICE